MMNAFSFARRTRRPWAGLLLLCAVLTAACSTRLAGGSHLYDRRVDPPVLLDSEIKIATHHSFRTDKYNEERIITMAGGKASATVRKLRTSGSADLSFAAYAEIWSELAGADYKKFQMEALDNTGGPYHVVTARMGSDVRQFSAQYTANFLGIGDRFRNEAIQMVNEVLRILAVHVPTAKVEPEADAESPAPAPAAEQK